MSNNSEYFDGQIRFVRVYNRTLSENEASQNYAALNNYSLNSAPTDISLTSTSVSKIYRLVPVGVLSTTDPDSGDTFTYSLVSSNDARDDDNGSWQ